MKHLFMIFFLSSFALTGCEKEGIDNPCYDSSIVHNGPCPADCPGIEGCDGKMYCNECEAARQGIKRK